MPGKTLSRNEEQTILMTVLYEALTYLDMKEEVDVEKILSDAVEKPYEEVSFYLKKSLIEALKNLPVIIEEFNKHMRKWTFDRLNRVEQAILIMSFAHYYYVEPEVDKKVVIDIAIKLSKTYLAPTDYKFVNAILDNVLIPENKEKYASHP